MKTPLERIHLRSLAAFIDPVERLLATRLWLQILLGMVLGVAVGILFGPSVGWVEASTAAIVGEWLALPGEIFLAVIQMIVVPLVLASVIRGIASTTDPEQLRRTGLGLAAYFLLTTVMATAIGIGLAYGVRPGAMIDPAVVESLGAEAAVALPPGSEAPPDAAEIPDALVSVLPTNALGAMVQADMLQVVVFSLIIGLALITLEPETSRPIFELMGSLQSVCLAVVGFVMRLAPVAVFGLLARVMIHTGLGILVGVGVYALTVIGGLLVLLLVYLLIVATLGRMRPLRFLADVREAQLLAFSTDSSAATMPVSIRVAEEGLGVRPSTAQFVIPMGATMNMGGTALYHGLATVFMAQMFGMDLGGGALLAIVLTSLGASIGAPATPGVGILILATVLTSAGVPLVGLTLIIGLDQILERFRCVMNVSGDLVACVVMDRRVGGPKSLAQEVKERERHEAERDLTGQDLVTA